MNVERSLIESHLKSKGFLEKKDNPHHRYYHHKYNGKFTGAYAYTSRGSKYKTYDISLIKRMKKELKLDSVREVVDLLKCPMSEEQYNAILQEKGALDTNI